MPNVSWAHYPITTSKGQFTHLHFSHWTVVRVQWTVKVSNEEYFFTKKEKNLLDVRGLLYCVVYPSIGKGIKGPIYPSPLFIIEQ